MNPLNPFEPPKIDNFISTKFKGDAVVISEDILRSLNQYNASLDENHEVAVMLASFGQSITVNITEIGYRGGKLIKFIGYLTENGTPVELYQHVNQLNFLLISVPRENPEEPKKDIGFIRS